MSKMDINLDEPVPKKMYSEDEVQKMIESEVSKIQSPKRLKQDHQTEPDVKSNELKNIDLIDVSKPVTPQIFPQPARDPRSISVKRLDPDTRIRRPM